jgi:hypothetical protein
MYQAEPLKFELEKSISKITGKIIFSISKDP